MFGPACWLTTDQKSKNNGTQKKCSTNYKESKSPVTRLTKIYFVLSALKIETYLSTVIKTTNNGAKNMAAENGICKLDMICCVKNLP